MPPSHRQTRPSGDVDGTSPPPPLPFFKLVPNFLVGIVWAAIYLGRWFETRFLHPAADFFLDVALTSAEEGAKSLLREGFAALSRGVDGATAAILALLVDRRYWRARRSLAGSRRRAAWADYWREGRPSTLNAVVARTGVKKTKNTEGEEGTISSPPPSPFARVAAAASAAAAAEKEGEQEEEARETPPLSSEGRDPSSSSLSPCPSAADAASPTIGPQPRLSSSSPSTRASPPPPAPPLRGPRPRGWAGKAASRAAHAAAGALVAARSAVAGDGGASSAAAEAAAAAAARNAAAPGLRGGMIPIDADAATARRAAADAAANASRAAAAATAAAAAAAANANAENSSSPMFSRAPSLRRNGSDLFDRANWSTDVARSRGLLEDTRLFLEEALSAAADALRAGVRWLLLMPGPPQPIDSAGNSGSFSFGFGGIGAGPVGAGVGGAGGASSLHFHNVAFPPSAAPRAAAPPVASSSSSASLLATHPGTTPGGATRWEELARDRPRGARVLRRSSSASQAAELLSEVRTAGDVVVAAGYPLEEHTVTTSDGYVLTMQRIPRRGARDVALFVHGIMDTSMGWVGNGVTGSHAFAAFDAGSDVWLANSRANPPCAHVDCPRMDPRGLRYWRYTVNEMAMEDVAAQVDHVHVVKTQELRPAAWWSKGAGGGGGAAAGEGEGQGASEPHRRAASEQPAANASSPPTNRPPASVLERGFARVAAADAAATLATPLGRVRPSASDSDLVSSPGRAALGGRVDNGGGDDAPAEEAAAAAAAAETPSTPRLASVAVLAAAAEATAALTGSAPPPNEATLRAAVVAGGAEGVLPARSILRHQASEAAAMLSSNLSSFSPSVDTAAVGWRRNAPGSAPPARGGETREGGGTPPHASTTTTTTTALSPLSPLPRARPLAASAASTPSRPPNAPSIAATAAAAVASAAAAAARAAAAASEDGLRRRRRRGEVEGSNVATADRAGSGGGEGAFLSAAAAAQVAAATAGAAEEDCRSPSTSPSSAAATEPYRLTAVGHSMGGAALLMYAVMSRVVRRPHHLARLVLLSPAGFQSKPPLLSRPFIRMVPLWTAFLDKVVGRFFVPGAGLRFLLPTSPLRFVAFKLTHDLRHLPAAEELARAFARACMSGDTSEWDRALRLPHYSARDMPSVSVHMGNHLCQWIRSDKFQLYDYGPDPKTGNPARYGTDTPPDVAALYRLLDVPVDIVAGRADGVVAAADVARHHRAMVAAGVKDVSYVEFPDAGHMDLVMSSKDDVRRYVMKLLRGRRGGRAERE